MFLLRRTAAASLVGRTLSRTLVPIAISAAILLGWGRDVSGQEISTLPTPSPPASDRADAADSETVFQNEARALSRAFRDAARKATPSVVTVFSYGQNVNAENPKRDSGTSDSQSDVQSEAESENVPPGDEAIGPSPPAQSEGEGYPLTGLGSGVIVDLMPESTEQSNASDDGSPKTYWVLTNQHVVAAARRVVIQLPDESELIAESVHGDIDSDIAVLKVVSDRPLAMASFGDSDQLEIGDWVLAIGSPFKLEATVCAGIISAKNRELEKIRRGRLLQTDAAINPGNSGGPLVDLDGNVIAISTAIATRNGGYQGIGFAIPVNQAKWIARELAQFERVRRAAMGVRLAELNPKVAKQFKLSAYLGILIHQIIKDSAADVAGLKQGDVILEFAGQRVRKMAALQQVVEQQPIGSTQEIKILRNGNELTKQIVLAPAEDPTATQPNEEPRPTE